MPYIEYHKLLMLSTVYLKSPQLPLKKGEPQNVCLQWFAPPFLKGLGEFSHARKKNYFQIRVVCDRIGQWFVAKISDRVWCLLRAYPKSPLIECVACRNQDFSDRP